MNATENMTHDEHTTETSAEGNRRISSFDPAEAVPTEEHGPESRPSNRQDWGSETVHPLYVSHEPGEISHATPIAGRRCLADWLSGNQPEVTMPTEPPQQVIRDLIVGRIFFGSDYDMLGESDLLPVMCASEVLDLVGIAAPTSLHLQICADVLRDLLGEPALILGRESWPIFPRFNDEELDPLLADEFPVPDHERYAAIHRLLQAAEPPRLKRQFIQARSIATMAIGLTDDVPQED